MKQTKFESPVNKRRIRTLARLESQLKSGVKIQKKTVDVTIPLTDKDVVRIEKEINTLKSKIVN